MRIEFELERPLVGFAGASATDGDDVPVIYRELVPPSDTTRVLSRLENLQGGLFSRIPDLPVPSRINHLLVVIKQDLEGIAYVNELNISAEIRPNRAIDAGEEVRIGDVEDVESVDINVNVPEEAGFVLVRSHGWRRSVLYDFGPLLDEPVEREYDLDEALAEQTLLLWGLAAGDEDLAGKAGADRLVRWRVGLDRLRTLLEEENDEEGEYQVLLEDHPWMLGGVYDSVHPHERLDDDRIPDFTARRSYDKRHDIIEIKHPFQSLFRSNGSLASAFNDAINQVRGYITFTQRQRSYLREERGILFENPKALLLTGYDLSDEERQRIREVEKTTPAVSVRTYDEVYRMAENVVEMAERAGEPVPRGAEIDESN